MKRGGVWLAVAAVSFLAAGACFFSVLNREKEKKDTAGMYEEMRREAVSSGKDTTGADDGNDSSGTDPGTDIPADPETDDSAASGREDSADTEHETEPLPSWELLYEDDLVIPVDFEKLQETNPDIYAWITVGGTEIDYPVVQNGEDDTYYLTRSAGREESVSGAIFSETYNATDFNDVHTVLYGHNMKDGSMFAGLHKFEDEAFFEENREINVYTPDAVRSYRIFAAYLYDDRHLLESADCTDPRVFEAYMKEVFGQRNLYAHIDKEITVEPGDHILTLSTCHSRGDSYRYLVQAVLEKEVRRI